MVDPGKPPAAVSKAFVNLKIGFSTFSMEAPCLRASRSDDVTVVDKMELPMSG